MQPLAQVLSDYRTQKKALPAFNIDSFEIYQAVEQAVRELHLPCLVQLSAGEDKFIEAERLFMLVKKAQADALPIYLNMDHGSDVARLKKMLHLGFDMVHFDASKLDYQTNQILTKDLAEYAHYCHALIEAEFDHIVPVDGSETAPLTDVNRAVEFVATTHCDLLAVSIGNQHGVGKTEEHLDLNLLSSLHSALPDSFLTLHGGSGINLREVGEAITKGIQKININTDLRLQFKKSLASSLASQDTQKIYDYLSPVVADLSSVIKQKLLAFTFS